MKFKHLSLALLIIVTLSTLISFVFNLSPNSKIPSQADQTTINTPTPAPTPTAQATDSNPSKSAVDKALQIATEFLAGNTNHLHESLLKYYQPEPPLTQTYDHYEYSYLAKSYDYDPQTNEYIMRLAPLPSDVQARAQPRDAQVIDLYYQQSSPDRFQITIHIDPSNDKIISYTKYYGNQ